MARRLISLISLPFLVMAAWTLMLGWLLVDARYQLFLAPKFKILLYAGSGLSLLFALGTARQPANRDRGHRIKGLVLILPLLFILSTGDSTLGNFALTKRRIAPLQTSPPPTESQEDAAAAGQNPQATAGEAPLARDLPLVSISRLIRDWDAYDGRRISVEGLFSETVVNHDELSAVFRYFITCCAADAMPVGIFLNRHPQTGLKNDDWVRASGKVRKAQMDGFEVIFMEAGSLEKREKPSKNAAYLFN